MNGTERSGAYRKAGAVFVRPAQLTQLSHRSESCEVCSPSKNVYASSRKHRIRKKGACFLPVLLCVLTVGLFFGSLKISFARTETPDYGRTKYYSSILIGEGDTLQIIADRYRTEEYEDSREYVEEVIQINHLARDGRIHNGEYLIVPYYR